METLRKDTPADGLIAGIGTINADILDEDRARAMVVSYDYTVLAGTQGGRNHYKQDRMFELAGRYGLPLVLFGEGGGGRPGDDRDPRAGRQRLVEAEYHPVGLGRRRLAVRPPAPDGDIGRRQQPSEVAQVPPAHAAEADHQDVHSARAW